MQARITDQAAFILRRRDWRNTSLILDLFTLDYGCVTVLAKGARRNPAKAQFQPFALLQLSWSGKQDLKTLTSIDSQALAIDEQNYMPLLYINELIAAFVPHGESNPEIFGLYLALLKLAEHKIDEASLRQFELGLMSVLGYFPDISQDAQSGDAICAKAHYQFVINNGFIACAKSARDSVSGQAVLDWIGDDYQKDTVRRLAKSVLRSTIDFNLHGKALKSRDVYQLMRRR